MGITSSLSTGVWERHKDDMHVNRDLCTWLALLYTLKRLKLIKFSSSKKYDKERFVWYPSIWGLFVSIYFSGSAYLMKHPSRVWYKPYWLNTVAEKDCNLRTWSRRSSLSGMRSFTSTSPEKDHKKKISSVKPHTKAVHWEATTFNNDVVRAFQVSTVWFTTTTNLPITCFINLIG